jgi:hypothetical protein
MQIFGNVLSQEKIFGNVTNNCRVFRLPSAYHPETVCETLANFVHQHILARGFSYLLQILLALLPVKKKLCTLFPMACGKCIERAGGANLLSPL